MKKKVFICSVIMVSLISLLLLGRFFNTENLSFIEESSELDITSDKEITSSISSTTLFSNPTFVIDTVEVNSESEEAVVNICIKGNTGISSIGMTVNYANELKLKEIVYNDEINGQTVKPEFNNSPIKLIWVNAFEEIDKDFIFVTLYFDITENGTGDFPISLYYNEDDVYDYEQNNIKFDVVNGKVKIN